MSRLILEICALAYLAAAVTYARQIARPGGRASSIAFGALATGFTVHTMAIAWRFAHSGTPATGFDQGLSFFAWLIVGIYFVLRTADRLTVIGAVVSPLAFALTLASVVLFGEDPDAVPLEYRSAWLPVHVTLAFLGNAVLALAFAVSVIYLVQERLLKSHRRGWMIRRLPSLEQLDRLNFRCLVWGFPLLTLGIVTGGMWALHTAGRFWSGEPREIMSLLTWLIYAALLQFRLTAGLRGRRAATLTIVAFGLVVASFVSIHVLALPGRHGAAVIGS
jgi:cytochrome c-type biogenesis protein CcsB